MSLRRDTIYNLAGHLVPLVATLATLPLFLTLIGEARFGLLALAWLLVSYLGLFDLGLGQALSQQLAKDPGALQQERARALRTALAGSALLGVMGAGLAWALGHALLVSVFYKDEALRSELITAIPWVALAAPVATVTSVLTGALLGTRRFLALNLTQAGANTLMQVMPLVVASLVSPALEGLVVAVVLTRMVAAAVLLVQCLGVLPGLKAARADLQTMRELLGFGRWVTVSAMVGPLIVMADRVVIGTVLGVTSVSHYVVPFQLAERVTLMSSALNAAVYPRVAALAPGSERDELAEQSLRFLALVLTPAVALAVWVISPFLSWWIAPSAADQSALVGQILFVAFWFNSLALVPYMQLWAHGRPDIVAKCHLAELAPYLAAMVAAVHLFGLIGAAWVCAFRAALDLVLLSALSGAAARSFRALATPAVLLPLLAANNRFHNPAGIGPVGLDVVFSVFLAAWWLVMLRTIRSRGQEAKSVVRD